MHLEKLASRKEETVAILAKELQLATDHVDAFEQDVVKCRRDNSRIVGSVDQELRAGVNELHEQVMDRLAKVEQIASPSARRGQGDDADYPTGNSPRQHLEENLSTTLVSRA